MNLTSLIRKLKFFIGVYAQNILTFLQHFNIPVKIIRLGPSIYWVLPFAHERYRVKSRLVVA